MHFRTQRRRRPFKDANAIQEPAFDKATWSVGRNSQFHQHSTTRSHQLEYLQSRIPKSTVSDQGPGARWHSSTMPNCILCMRCLHVPSCSISYLSAHEYLHRCSAHFSWDAAAINLAFRPGSRSSAPPASSSSAPYAQYSPYMHQHHVWNASTKMWLRSQLHHLLLLRLAQVDLPPALSVKLQTAVLAPKGARARARARATAVSWETCGNSSCAAHTFTTPPSTKPTFSRGSTRCQSRHGTTKTTFKGFQDYQEDVRRGAMISSSARAQDTVAR